GLAITSGVLAVVLDGRASDHYDRIERGNATPAIADAFARERDRRDDARTACWLFGGAALAAGTAGFLLYTFDTPGEAVRVAPLATGTSAGVTASGRF
ncbi:MAG TPA: hypothetical protein VK427_21490, partial [Kofleriaceae bacterium]|nr:hypothetical protein [Kofleriaceae bacterium]